MVTKQSGNVSRIAYIDGLRGIAIGLVVFHHAYMDLLHSGHRLPGFAPFRAAAWLGTHGYLGVPLFFVLSGFCLSYPALRRRKDGREDWFVPSDFFARRCLRILPPYYAALAIFVFASLAVSRLHLHRLTLPGRPLDVPNVLTHVFLVHNLTPYHDSINGPFWSLGLEWQWYWVFPVLLFLCLRSVRLGLLACLSMTIAWHFMIQPWSGAHHLEGQALPGTLLMFCYGIVGAKLVISRPPIPAWLLVLGSFLPIVLAEMPATQHVIGAVGLYESCYGLAFLSLLLLGAYNATTMTALSARPLAFLGLISYSVYLIHQPLMAVFDIYAQRVLHGSPVAMIFSIAVGIGAGAAFHLVVERPCTRRETWQKVSPFLLRALAWTDLLYGKRRVRPLLLPAQAPRLEGVEQLT